LATQVGSEMVKYKIIIALILFCLPLGLVAQVLENYQEQVNREQYKTWFKKHQALAVRLDLDAFPKSNFRFHIPAEGTAFVNNTLWFVAEHDTILEIPLQDFKEQFSLQDSLAATMTVLKDKIQLGEFAAYKGYFSQQKLREPTVQSGERLLLEREISVFYDFFYLSLLIVFLLIALYKMVFPLELGAILKPLSVFSAEDFSDSTSFQKFFTVEVLFFLIVVSMLISSLVLVLVKEGYYPALSNLVNEDVNRLFLLWLIGTLLLTGLSVLKFIFLRILIFIFDLGRLEFPHFFYLLRIISIIVIGVSLVVTFTTLNYPDRLDQVIEYSIVGFFWAYVFGIVLLFLIMMNRVSFKNYHLFTYICTAEFVPFLIISKLIIG
jgi:hypothetical protein